MNIALIFAGGTGTRMGNDSLPKQFLKVNGKEIIIHTLEIFDKNPEIEMIICVCVIDWINYLREIILVNNLNKVISVVPGGINPQESQYFGLREAGKIESVVDQDIILVHDGVRPLIDDDLISRVITCTQKNGSAICYSPAIETVVTQNKKSMLVEKILDRGECALLKAPQAFKFGDLWNSHLRARNDGKIDFIDSASLMMYYGYKLFLVESSTTNIKVTTPIDYKMLSAIYSD